MAIRIHCPTCKTEYTLADETRGKKLLCRACRKPFAVPGDRAANEGAKTQSAVRPPPRTVPAPAPTRPAADRGGANTERPQRPTKRADGPPARLGLWIALGASGAGALVLVIVLLVTLGGKGEQGQRPPNPPPPVAVKGGDDRKGKPVEKGGEPPKVQPQPFLVDAPGGKPPRWNDALLPKSSFNIASLPLKAPLEIVEGQPAAVAQGADILDLPGKGGPDEEPEPPATGKPAIGIAAFVFLDRAPPPTEYKKGVSYGILRRELLRQAVLLAARDGLGLTARDGELGEVPPAGLPPRQTLAIDLLVHDDQALRLSVESGPPAARQSLWRLEGKIRDDVELVRWTEFVEAQTRGRLPRAFRKVGFEGQGNAVRADGPLPERLATLLDQMDHTSQFEAVREVHALMRRDGESPQLLGALARGYANLGLLTEFQWTATHKAFKARALLYAQRLVARAPQEPWGRWHRAYALALTGLHRQARSDLARAAELAKAPARLAAPALRQPPAWVGAIDAYCCFDTGRLAVPADAQVAQLTTLLRYLTVEDPVCTNLTLSAGAAALKANPECYRVHDYLSGIGGVSSQHVTTLAGMDIFRKAFPERLARLPGLPPAVADLARASAAEADLGRALREAGRDVLDRAEPSWPALAELARETRFMQAWRRLYFMRYLWSVPVKDFLDEARPLVKGHAYAGFLESFALDSRRQRAEKLALLRALPLRDLQLTQLPLYQIIAEVDGQLGNTLRNRSMREMDDLYRDYTYLLTQFTDARRLAALAATMEKFSPDAPALKTSLIQHNWAQAQPQAESWERKAQQPRILLELGKQYAAARRLPEAERCLKGSIALSPDLTAFRALAETYKGQGQLELWQQTLEAVLREPDPGLGHAQVRVELAREFMKHKDYKKAAPYAEAAAETYAGWAMQCASECYEGLQDWAKAELWARRTSERYQASYEQWFFFCKRTGQGDAQAAGALFARYIAAVGPNPTPTDLSNFGAFYLMTGQPQKAQQAFLSLNRQFRAESVALFVALGYDELGDRQNRDEALRSFPGQNTPFAELAELFRAALARGEKGTLEAEKAEKVLRGMSPKLQADACYFLGRFAAQRGQGQQARLYLSRSGTAATPQTPMVQMLARDRLRGLGGKQGGN